MSIVRKALTILLAVAASLPVMAQQQTEQSDSLVRLLKSQYVQMVDVEGGRYRKVVGPARFLHNDTYLLCDTAYWNVETNIIDAWGNVSILQEETVLTSDKLIYLVDSDLAQFRGTLVELTDKDHNTLRTRHLDYNTKDSVAVFMNGGSMRDKDGQIIESRNGTYDSKISTFTFENDVNMFTDSIFVKTRDLVYESDLNLATFGRGTNAWKEDNMLSADSGWYDREREIFLFTDNVHVMSVDQEGWCDSLYFYRMSTGVEMLGNAQVTDTTRNVFALAGRIDYVDSISKVTLTRKPAVITQTETEDGGVDTVYLGADKLVYFTMKMCDIDPAVVKDAEKRLEALNTDPVGTFRKKAAEEAAKAAEEAAKQDPNYRPNAAPKASAAPYLGPGRPVADTLGRTMPTAGLDSLRTALADSLAQKKAVADTVSGIRPMVKRSLEDSLMNAGTSDKDTSSVAVMPVTLASDSLNVPVMPMMPGMTQSQDSLMTADSTAAADSSAMVPPDTTKIGFLEALGNVKIYRKDMQVVCDSLTYSDLDSLARLFKDPVVYQEIVRQYKADSISIVVNDGALEKASLMSNAFITIQEDTTHYNQIKGTEMMAYFDEKGGLKRFDVLGGASALFFLEENGALATVNKTDSKMMSATFKNGEIQRIYYFEEAKNDGYPVVQIGQEDRLLKGYSWNPERRPADRYAVTPLKLRPSQRESYSAIPRAKFVQTDIYFPGYIDDIYRQMEVRDSLRIVRNRERALAEERAKTQARLDSLALADSLANASQLDKLDSLAVADSLAKMPVADSLKVADSLSVAAPLTPEQISAAEKAAAKAAKEKLKAERKAAKEAKRKAKQEALEAKWAEADRRDAEKAAEKAAKKLDKERAKKRKALADEQRQKDRDAAMLEKYRQKFEKRKAREDAKAALKRAVAEAKAAGNEAMVEKISEIRPEDISLPELRSDVSEGTLQQFRKFEEVKPENQSL